MADLNTHQSVAITESIYYLNDQPGRQSQLEKLKTEYRYSSNSRAPSSKMFSNTSDLNFCLPKHLRSSDYATELDKRIPLRLRNGNRQYNPNSSMTMIAKEKIVSPAIQRKSGGKRAIGGGKQSRSFVSIPRPRPTTQRPEISQHLKIKYESHYPKTIEAKQSLKATKQPSPVPQIKPIPVPSKLLFSKIDVNSPSFSNILEDLQSQQSSERIIQKQLTQATAQPIELLNPKIDKPDRPPIQEEREEEDESCSSNYSPKKIQSKLNAIYSGCFKIHKR